MDYSKTVNLPKSDFPMKANLPNREPAFLKKWEDDQIYKKIQESRKDKETFILHDGPPYANGHIHIGHALNKILKDVIVKHKTMMGYRAPYVPGWDCHGLPIELNVTKKLGKNARSMPKVDIRKGCREYAEDFVSLQADEFKRLGVFAEYDNPYKTLTNDYEAKIIDVFAELLEKKYIYRSKKPIYWCSTCVTALAEAEVEYDEHTSTSIYTKFPVESSSIEVDGIDKDHAHVVIWTTTPWTLPANLAVSFNPEFGYSAYKYGSEYYIFADGLLDQFEKKTGLTNDGQIVLSRQDIEKFTVLHPFIDRESMVVFGRHVTLEQGTGVVHTAPGHGHDDYLIGLEYGLEVYCPVDDYGKYTEDFPEMKGTKVFEANSQIIEMLKEHNRLIYTEDIEHSYPHCWRCKKPLIYRATEQWFLGIDHDNMREKGIEVVDKTKWIPAWGESRFRSMVEGRPDWCLSRQRTWGVPIPSFRCADCGENLMTTETVQHFAKIARSENVDAWYSREIEDLLPEGTKCKCGSTNFIKETDILDVWFDSGVSNMAVLDEREDHSWPADLYLEGSDQHRGWFQSSLWPALALKGEAPYKAVLTHGFVLDDKGKAMSKSIGNVIAPEKLINQFGADILRLWVTSEDYRNDLRIGMDMVKQVSDSYRKIRNTFKFILGNISDFQDENKVAYDELMDLDKWILHKLKKLHNEIIAHYENFEFHLVYRKIVNFCAIELSSIYFDISKDILYVEAKDSKLRRSAQTALSEIFKSISQLMAPILVFTAEEIWQFNGNENSIHLNEYYKLDEKYNNVELETKIQSLVDVKKDILKSLELLRREKIVKSSLEADITIYINDSKVKDLISEMGDDAKRFFQVANLKLVDDKNDTFAEYDNSSLIASKTEGLKCVRCWNFYEKLGSDSEHPELCERCTKIIKSM